MQKDLSDPKLKKKAYRIRLDAYQVEQLEEFIFNNWDEEKPFEESTKEEQLTFAINQLLLDRFVS